MPRGKSVVKTLLNSSEAALFAGIEIHNKPHIAYRYQTTAILIINAWELLLKAYIYKYIGTNKIFEKNGHTITFDRCLALTQNDILSKNKNFKAVVKNLEILNIYRSNVVHFSEPLFDPILFMVITKTILNYDEFVQKYFKKDITQNDNLIILPVGFRLPLDPISYLKQDYGKAQNIFVDHIVKTIKLLHNEKIEESVVIGFNVYTESCKKIFNADILAAIDNENATVKLTKEYRITNNPNAPEVRIGDNVLPLNYNNLRERVRKLRPDIKFGKKFNKVMEKIKEDKTLSMPRYLDPHNKKSGIKYFYAYNAIEKVIKLYDKETTFK